MSWEVSLVVNRMAGEVPLSSASFFFSILDSRFRHFPELVTKKYVSSPIVP